MNVQVDAEFAEALRRVMYFVHNFDDYEDDEFGFMQHVEILDEWILKNAVSEVMAECQPDPTFPEEPDFREVFDTLRNETGGVV